MLAERNYFNFISIVFSIIISCVVSFPATSHAQLFQNNNNSCEDHLVVGSRVNPQNFMGDAFLSQSITCGHFSGSGFPDCITQMDPIYFEGPNLFAQDSNSLLLNTGAHGQNCINAGEENSQFANALGLRNSSFDPAPIETAVRMGNIVHGNLDNQGLDDIAFVFVENRAGQQSDLRSLQYIISQEPWSAGDFLPQHADLVSGDLLPPVPFPTGFEFSFEVPFSDVPQEKNASSDPSFILANCDNDPVDEGIAMVRRRTAMGDSVGLLVSQNSGNGLEQTLPQSFEPLPFVVQDTGRLNATLTAGDFNGDQKLDLIIASHSTAGGSETGAIFCSGDGACGFSCPNQINDPNFYDLTCQQDDCRPTSIASGDFDGNGLKDVVVSLSWNQFESKLVYLMNNGGNFSSWTSLSKDLPALGSFMLPYRVVAGRFSTAAIQNNIDEVATSVLHYAGQDFSPATTTVQVLTSDGQGGISDPLTLDVFSSVNFKLFAATGIDIEDFDGCGGQDIMVLSTANYIEPGMLRAVSLFLNTNEEPVVNLDAEEVGTVNQQIPLVADCMDPTFDNRGYSWQIVSAPVDANASIDTVDGELKGKDNTAIQANFVADLPGEYDIVLSCVDFCGAATSKNIKIQVSEEEPLPGTTTGTTTGNSTAGSTTGSNSSSQGGCIASLSGYPPTLSFSYFICFLFSISGLGLFRYCAKGEK